MIGRILRTELRRSSALTAGGLVVVLGAAGLYSMAMTGQTSSWDTEWTVLAVFQRIMLAVLWPLALGAGAWQARRDRRTRMEELLGTTPRPAWRRVLPTSAAMAIWLTAGYAVMLAAGAVRVAGNTDYRPVAWIPVALVGALSLVAAGWLGMGIGRLAPSTYTPPVLAVAGFLVLLVPVQVGKDGPIGNISLLAPLFSGPIDEFTAVAGAVNAGQAVWFIGLALGGLALLMAARRRWTAVAVVPVVAGLLLAVPLLDSAPEGGFRADLAAASEVCTSDGGPAVCVTKVHEAGLAALTGPARRALTLLAKLPAAPTSVHEVTASRPGPQPAAEVWFHSDNYRAGHGWESSGEDLAVRVLAGAGTRPCPDAEGRTDYRTRAIVSAWLYGRYPAPGPEVSGAEATARDAAWRALRALPADEQLRQVTAVRREGLTCDSTGSGAR
jgi:hypothetical protein